MPKPHKPLNLREQCCHVFALSGDTTGQRDVNEEFTNLTNQIGFQFNFGKNLDSTQLAKVRQDTTSQIALLRDATVFPVEDLYLCAGFRNGQVSPEHMWLEDRTRNVTIDTMPNQPIKVLRGFGEDGEPFGSACEAIPFNADEIVRVKVSGYTAGQVAAMFRPAVSKVGVFSDKQGKNYSESDAKSHHPAM